MFYFCQSVSPLRQKCLARSAELQNCCQIITGLYLTYYMAGAAGGAGYPFSQGAPDVTPRFLLHVSMFKPCFF